MGDEKAEKVSETFNFEEYQSIPSSDFGEKERDELSDYIDYLRKDCKRLGIEDKPKKEGNFFELKSYCGSYEFENGEKIRIHRDRGKLSDESFSQLLEDITSLVPMVGIDKKSLLAFLGESTMADLAIVYSDLLNDLTGNVLKEGPPVRLREREIISETPQGEIKIHSTIKKRSQGEPLCVSKKVYVTYETLPLLLFVRFHFELSNELQDVLNEIENKNWDGRTKVSEFAISRKIKNKNRPNHIDILSDPLYNNFIDKARKVNFNDPEILEKTRNQAITTFSLQDVLKLWNAYRSESLPKPLFEKIIEGGYSLKPTSKLYELWVLKMLVSATAEVLQCSLEKISGTTKRDKTIFFENDVKLYYNGFPGDYRKITGALTGLRPDFVLIGSDDKIKLIADAKYKKGQRKSDDLKQMAIYNFAYGWKDSEDQVNSLLIYTGKENYSDDDIQVNLNVKRSEGPEAMLSSLVLRPKGNHGVAGYKSLKDYIEKLF